MIETCYSKEENIVYQFRKGSVGLLELMDNIDKLNEEYSHLALINIVDDIRGSTPDFMEQDFGMILMAIKSHSVNYKRINCAVIVNEPHNAALSIMFESEALIIDNFFYKTFSTAKAAKEWLEQSSNG